MKVSPERYARIALLGVLTTLASPAATASPASAAPSCAEGPRTEGEAIVGTPCDDTIRAPRGVTTVFGEGGNDTLYGQRGNDNLFGGEGNDRLYGGVGDDRVRGGPGNDLLSGGFGGDSLDGEGGDDFDRGDATIDSLGDSGGGTDTLSFATGVTPGFPNESPFFDYEGFPSDGEEGGRGRGVYTELAAKFANDGIAPAGGGVDKPLEAPNFEDFETVIGTAFSDFIVGTTGAETIYGGGGADVIRGKGGGDTVVGGAEGDYCETGPGISASACEFSGGELEVGPRDPSLVSAGLTIASGGAVALYLTGSDGDDDVTANYTAGAVSFELGAGSSFDSSSVAAGGCTPQAADEVSCAISQAPDSVVLAGLEGDDSLSATGFPATTSVILLGGEDGDILSGGATEDALVDGPGVDTVSAGSGDDAVPNNEGKDTLDAGPGEDLFISNAVCEGDSLNGGPDRDNANWANFGSAIAIEMAVRKAGLAGPSGQPQCSSGSLTNLEAIEDVEGTDADDTLVGDPGENQLLGRGGHDSYFAAAGNDSILANSGDQDVTIDCGEGFDTAQVDHPQYGDPAPVGCEAIHERDPNSFRPPDTPPDPNPTAEASAAPAPAKPPPRQAKDRTPPRTMLLRHPQRTIFTGSRMRRVSVAFDSNEAGASFRCKLDGGPFKPCRSPRAYVVRLGAHAIRIFAIDRAGNRDRTPALFKFRVRRR